MRSKEELTKLTKEFQDIRDEYEERFLVKYYLAEKFELFGCIDYSNEADICKRYGIRPETGVAGIISYIEFLKSQINPKSKVFLKNRK